MTVNCGKHHDYLGMQMDFSHDGEVCISMVKYIVDVYKTLEKVQAKIDGGFVMVKTKKSRSQLTAAPKNLFVVNEECDKLSESQREVFHSCVAKLLYFSKRARADVLPSISVNSIMRATFVRAMGLPICAFLAINFSARNVSPRARIASLIARIVSPRFRTGTRKLVIPNFGRSLSQ